MTFYTFLTYAIGVGLRAAILHGIHYMSVELDNANAALATLQAATASAIAKIDALKAAPAGVDPAAVQSLADGMNAAAASLTAASA
jgi:hypothetical protein